MAFKPSKRSSRSIEEIEINLTPVMNLMVVLIPLLLSSATYVKIGVIDLNLPPAVGTTVSQLDAPKETEKKLDLAITITNEGFYISSSMEIIRGTNKIGPSIPLTEDRTYDFKKLSEKLYEIKKQSLNKYSDTENVVIQAAPEVRYQLLIDTMDAARECTVNGQKYTLFPDVSLAAGVI